MVKWVDIPPVWLAGALGLAWVQARVWPVGGFGDGLPDLLAGILVGGGVILLALALFEMRRHRTTFWPHGAPTRIVTSGIFKRSRNPIYLGDVMILAGMVIWWDAVLALVLVPLLVWVLEKRFITAEERGLRHRFPREFIQYEKDVRRWV